jgi:hypothetical protein
LRDVFDAVEAALRLGIRREFVLAELHKHGFTMQMGGFKSTIQRIRKERAKAANSVKPEITPSYSPGPSNVAPLPMQLITTQPFLRSKMASTELPETPDTAGKLPIQKILDEPIRRQSYKSRLKKD